MSVVSAGTKAAPPPRSEPSLRVTHREALDFPAEASRRGIDDVTMVVHFRVAPDGSVEQVTADDVDPPGTFDSRLKRALQRWTFEPPGRTLEKSIKITVHAGS